MAIYEEGLLCDLSDHVSSGSAAISSVMEIRELT